MRVQINKRIYELLGGSRGNYEYLLDWITGYTHRKKSLKIFSAIDFTPILEPSIEIEIDEEIVGKIRKETGLKDTQKIDPSVNLFLMIAYIMGEGE